MDRRDIPLGRGPSYGVHREKKDMMILMMMMLFKKQRGGEGEAWWSQKETHIHDQGRRNRRKTIHQKTFLSFSLFLLFAFCSLSFSFFCLPFFFFYLQKWHRKGVDTDDSSHTYTRLVVSHHRQSHTIVYIHTCIHASSFIIHTYSRPSSFSIITYTYIQ